MRLLNALLEASNGPLPQAGRPYVHLTRFVSAQVLGQLQRRQYRRVLRMAHAASKPASPRKGVTATRTAENTREAARLWLPWCLVPVCICAQQQTLQHCEASEAATCCAVSQESGGSWRRPACAT